MNKKLTEENLKKLRDELDYRMTVKRAEIAKEKLIAAYKADIKTALIPRKNYERDLKDIPSEVRDNMEIIAVDTFSDVLEYTLV